MIVCDCENPEQCFELCGELGHDEEYVDVVDDEDSFLIDELVRKGRFTLE